MSFACNECNACPYAYNIQHTIFHILGAYWNVAPIACDFPGHYLYNGKLH